MVLQKKRFEFREKSSGMHFLDKTHHEGTDGRTGNGDIVVEGPFAKRKLSIQALTEGLKLVVLRKN